MNPSIASDVLYLAAPKCCTYTWRSGHLKSPVRERKLRFLLTLSELTKCDFFYCPRRLIFSLHPDISLGLKISSQTASGGKWSHFRRFVLILFLWPVLEARPQASTMSEFAHGTGSDMPTGLTPFQSTKARSRWL